MAAEKQVEAPTAAALPCIVNELEERVVGYVYKSGEASPSTAAGFDLVEATVARACIQNDVAYAIQAKREIGKLWDDIEKAPYKVLFNPSVTGPVLWRAVHIVRSIDQVLVTKRANTSGRERLLAIHGNRFITHLVLSCLPQDFTTRHGTVTPDEDKQLAELTTKVFTAVFAGLNRVYPDAYLASLFKNATKCQDVKRQFSCP